MQLFTDVLPQAFPTSLGPRYICCTRTLWYMTYSEGKKKGKGHVSEDSGEDLNDQAQKDALNSFTITKNVPAGGGAKKKAAGKKKGKGKKK